MFCYGTLNSTQALDHVSSQQKPQQQQKNPKQTKPKNQIKQTNKNNTKKKPNQTRNNKKPTKKSPKPLNTKIRVIFLELQTSLAYHYSLVQIHELMENISCTLHPMCDLKSGLNSY